MSNLPPKAYHLVGGPYDGDIHQGKLSVDGTLLTLTADQANGTITSHRYFPLAPDKLPRPKQPDGGDKPSSVPLYYQPIYNMKVIEALRERMKDELQS